MEITATTSVCNIHYVPALGPDFFPAAQIRRFGSVDLFAMLQFKLKIKWPF